MSRSMPRSAPGTFRRSAAALAAILLVASTTAGCFAEPSALPTVRDFLVAWQVGNYTAAAKHTTGDPVAVARALGQVHEQLDAAAMRLGLLAIHRNGDDADAEFEVKIDLGENGEPWDYQGQMRLKRINGRWKVQWSPSVIHPRLSDGERLAVVTESEPRAPVQDAAGRSLLRTVHTDIVGVYPGSLRDRKRTLTQLARRTRLDAERLIGRVGSAPPEKFLPLLTLQQPGNTLLSYQLAQIDGVQIKTAPMPIVPAMARDLVGTLGPATAKRLQEVGAPYQPGDTVGTTGLQMLYQRRLAGIPTVTVIAQDPQGRMVDKLWEWRGTQSEPVRTTLDRYVQLSAEQALSRLTVPASLVAVRSATGDVLAVANHRTGAENLAFEGHYPPGMTFSIVSSEPLLQNGQQVNAPAPCPATANVGDQVIRSQGWARPRSTFQANFAHSCTTAFAALSRSIDGAALVGGANRFGIGSPWMLPVPAFSGSVPLPTNDTDKALAMIGEGKVRMSPLSMALVAGTVSSGTWRPPQLLKEPTLVQKVDPQPLDTNPITALSGLLRMSVRGGAARSANLPGSSPVRGVTSIVSYNVSGQNKVVSWFVGYRGDVAVALAIEGRVNAAKIAATFLHGPRRVATR